MSAADYLELGRNPVRDGAPGGESCRDVVTQLAAVTHALNRAGFLMISSAMENCIVDPEGAEKRDGMTTDELEKVFLALA